MMSLRHSRRVEGRKVLDDYGKIAVFVTSCGDLATDLAIS